MRGSFNLLTVCWRIYLTVPDFTFLNKEAVLWVSDYARLPKETLSFDIPPKRMRYGHSSVKGNKSYVTGRLGVSGADFSVVIITKDIG